MPPRLNIPVGYDLDGFQRQSSQIASKVGETVKDAARIFQRVNGEMLGIASATAGGAALAWGQSAASIALKLTLLGTVGFQAFKLLSSAIDQAREDLAAMIEIADGARNTALSPEFFQKWINESKKLQISGDELKSSLDHAFQATKVQLNDGWLQGDATKTKVDDITKAVRELGFELFTVDHQSSGALLFKQATTQEEKIRAVLVLMTELNRMGEQAAALNLGEKLFGGQWADRARQGRVSAEGMLEALDESGRASNKIFPAELVARAKEVDDQLKIANQRLQQDLKPSFEAIERAVLSVKSAWVSIVDLMARALELLGKLRSSSADSPGVDPLLRDTETSLKTKLTDKGLSDLQRRGLQDQLSKVQSQILQAELKAGTFDLAPPGPPGSTTYGNVPLPAARPVNAPKPPPAPKGEGRDRFDAASDSIERRTAALVAETAHIDENTAARERAKVVAQLEEVAKQANAAAGRGENVILDEQRERINAVADAYARAAANIERARSPLATFAREAANVDRQLNAFAANSLNTITDSLAGVVVGTTSVKEAFRNMAQSMIQDLARIAIRATITGPIANALFGGVFGGVGGGGLFGGFRADGGGVSPGASYIVGERGPEVFRPNVAGTILPNSAGSGASSAATFNYSPMIDARGADAAAVARLAQVVANDKRTFDDRARSAVSRWRGNNPKALAG